MLMSHATELFSSLYSPEDFTGLRNAMRNEPLQSPMLSEFRTFVLHYIFSSGVQTCHFLIDEVQEEDQEEAKIRIKKSIF